QVALGAVVLGLFVSALGGLWPHVVSELQPVGLGPADTFGERFDALLGPGSWWLLAALSVALAVALWDRFPSAAVCGLAVLALTVSVLAAGAFRAELAAASALRWGWAVSFLLGSLALVARHRLLRGRARLGCPGEVDPAASVVVR